MSDMLEQLLTLSRADSHGLVLRMEDTDLQTLLLETYENFLPLAADSGHLLSIRLPEAELPLCSCDVSRIRQVCHILLHNALSYTPSGSTVLLFIAEGSYEKEISIGVQDNGPGICDEEKESRMPQHTALPIYFSVFCSFYGIPNINTSPHSPSRQGPWWMPV